MKSHFDRRRTTTLITYRPEIKLLNLPIDNLDNNMLRTDGFFSQLMTK